MSENAAIPTLLLAEHRQLGAHMAPFAGFLMPIRYGGIFAEHKAVRECAGLFDLSHMGQVEIEGDGALELFDRISTNQLSTLKVGKARYSILMQNDGGAIDDIIVYRLEKSVLVVVNAANTARSLAAITNQAPDNLRITHRSDRALIALQGPRSEEILAPLLDGPIAGLANYACQPARIGSTDILVARTGYTGEDGFELFVPGSSAVEIFRLLLQAGKQYGIMPAGLAARDILRLEAGMPLYGNEMSATITPLQAGQAWAIKFDKGDFLGRAALLAQKEAGYSQIVGLKLNERIPARAGYAVFDGTTRVGEIRSATIAPSVGDASIATALVDAGHTEIGHTLSVEIRGTLYTAEVVSLPFYRRIKTPVTI
jgi:aminomethyltransferase